jgi:SAM-dependent methyltransferase
MMKFLSYLRSIVMKLLKPKSGYVLFPPQKSLKPISNKYGYDRGTPIDRWYIEKFLDDNKQVIRGYILEIHDDAYTKKYGEDRVTKIDILDIDQGNKLANIYGDLRRLSNVADNTYDTLIITQTFGMIDDFDSAIKECHRILKPGGAILATVSSMAPCHNDSFWRFTQHGLAYAFGKYFPKERIKSVGLGNVLSGQGFWVGLAREELTDEELSHNDPEYPLIAGVVANK